MKNYVKEYKGHKVPEVPPEWNGGLPPIGCEFEIKRKEAIDAEWISFKLLANDCGVMFGWSGKEPAHFNAAKYEFRPLKTQEQKDREAFIDRVMAGISIDVKHATIAHNIAEQLFDAGYKAPEGE